jgi:hypothetical protein
MHGSEPVQNEKETGSEDGAPEDSESTFSGSGALACVQVLLARILPDIRACGQMQLVQRTKSRLSGPLPLFYKPVGRRKAYPTGKYRR